MEDRLTPHTLRLLKLIEAGTTDHAKLAVAHLKNITKGSSPLVLWEILGRLQAFLVANDWSTRSNAGLAMEGIAQHLPVQDQDDFLSQDHRYHEHRCNNSTDEELSTWLSIHDLKGNLRTVLTKGRLLVSSVESRYQEDDDDEDDILETVDAHYQGSEQFCRMRLGTQRSILAKRLGLSGVLAQYTVDFEQSIKSQLEPPQKKQKRDHQASKKRKRISIRNLLTTEIIQQQQQQQPQQQRKQQKMKSKTVSHRNAQALLAGELMFRIFDPSWHVRHGSLIGILSLIRAWKINRTNHEERSFGVWPHDILARTLCVLALDRFGDYSGASMDGGASNGMVAPVRVMAGQVFAVVFIMSPELLQLDVINLLKELLQHEDWETRQGALVAIKYIVALVGTSTNFDELSRWKKQFLMFFIDHVIAGLEDKNDDVQAVASEILYISVPYFDTDTEKENYIPRIFQSLWKSLLYIRGVSSSIDDIMKLLSQIIRTNLIVSLNAIPNTTSPLDSLAQILTHMNKMLQDKSIFSKISVLHMISALSGQLTHLLSKRHQTTIYETGKIQATTCFCDNVKSVYRLSREINLAQNNNNNDPTQSGTTELDTLHQACSETWTILSDVASIVFYDDILLQNELDYELMTIYFDTAVTTDFLGEVLKNNANTIAIFLNRGKKPQDVSGYDTCSGRYDILELFLRSYADSPFAFHCEALCLFIQALFDVNVQILLSNDRTNLLDILQYCQIRLFNTLQMGLSCKFHEELIQLLKETSVLKTMTDSVRIGYNIILQKRGSGKAAAASVVGLWRKARVYPKCNDHPVSVLSVSSMRLSSQIVGTLVAGGIESLPTKLTPIVRPLMTSIKNEQNKRYQHSVSSYMKCFLLLIINGPVPSDRKDGFQKTLMKVLNNICNMLLFGIQPGCKTASLVIGSLVRNLREGTTLKLLTPLWDKLQPLRSVDNKDVIEKSNALLVLRAVCQNLKRSSEITTKIFDDFLPALIDVGCSEHTLLRNMSSIIIKNMCSVDESLFLSKALPLLIIPLQDIENDTSRSGACLLLRGILDSIENISIVCPFVRTLIPVVMSMMIDPIKVCAETSASIFSYLVQVAPLVEESVTFDESKANEEANLVIDHLIHGKNLTICKIDPKVSAALSDGGITLRNYQLEGVSWLRFLQSINLNGALCDSMGLGKTLQALLGVSLAHIDYDGGTEKAKSLVICPSSVVGHWLNEIERCFPGGSVFRAFTFIGNTEKRKYLWKNKLKCCNLIITSYEVLRSEVDSLSDVNWTYCILDEGHLLRNPKTMTSRASKRLRSRHKLILTGTLIQNSVNELWAVFDFLMPNFLGSSSNFTKDFAKPINKGQKFDASAVDIAASMEKLKLLHQQVLPFILRREKQQVLQELPPKIITRIPCPMSSIQENLYQRFCSNQQGKQLISAMNKMVNTLNVSNANSAVNTCVLKSLLYLRLLCTHPCLVKEEIATNKYGNDNSFSIEDSGKLIALRDLLRDAGLNFHDLTAADNDSSLLYCEKDEEQEASDSDEYYKVLDPSCEDSDTYKYPVPKKSMSKCLIFGQFTSSLDVVEHLLLKRYMPSVRYLRLDGRVPVSNRSSIVDKFNHDDSVRLLLLTTKVGGLGLNLTGADTVIFLELDFNPHTDLQV